MGQINVVEFPNHNWNIYPDLDSTVIEGRTAREHLRTQDIEWHVANKNNVRTADLLLFTGMIDRPPYPRMVLKAFIAEIRKRARGRPFLTLIGEPRELCRISYLFSDKESTLCVPLMTILTGCFCRSNGGTHALRVGGSAKTVFAGSADRCPIGSVPPKNLLRMASIWISTASNHGLFLAGRGSLQMSTLLPWGTNIASFSRTMPPTDIIQRSCFYLFGPGASPSIEGTQSYTCPRHKVFTYHMPWRT